jgi:murein DD-endopeptidase MepM/ murein hydrolase activator NlpD
MYGSHLWRKRLRLAAIILFGSLVMAACGGDDASNSGATITPIGTLATPSDVTNGSALIELRDFSYPIAGGCLPKGDQLMPNAPRVYRNGIHEGVDLYDEDNCTRISRGSEVLAARQGRVVRADLAYVDITAAEVAKYSQNPNTEEALDKYRGRQVWIEHGVDSTGNKIVTRYAHLSGIAPGIAVGAQVSRGQLIAFVGESGTPESVSNPGSEYHLHFELRVGDSYLGKALPPAQVRSLYLALFSP